MPSPPAPPPALSPAAASDSRLAHLQTPRDCVRWAASAFGRAGLAFGHGTDNALDEAFHLVLSALHLPGSLPAVYLEARLLPEEAAAVLALLDARLATRQPAAYLLGEIQFAGLPFVVTPDVLVPRSPFASLIAARFAPWWNADGPEPARILDLCAGSGCIGIAAAHVFPEARVDLAELSESALAVCRTNIERLGVEDRVRAVASDVFAGVAGESYELILTNPPYVPEAEWEALPAEYHAEPKMALVAGPDGMDIVARILDGAAARLAPGGWLFCEVGASTEEFTARWPELPVTWLHFETEAEGGAGDGDGVFAITREELVEAGFGPVSAGGRRKGRSR